MLRKLMKHELRATGRVMGPMLGITLLSSLGGNLAINGLLGAQSQLLSILGSLLLTAFGAAIAGSFIVSFVLMIRRFYKNLLRDEGYLMMTLPATVHEHVLSKLFVSMIWAAATAITAALAMGILLFDLEFVTFFGAEELLAELSFGDMRLVDYAGHAALLCIEVILLMIAAEACLCLQMYAAMAVGHSFTHHKGLLSFAAYLVLCIAWNLVQSAAMHVLGVITPEGIQLELNISAFAATHITLWSLILCSLIPSSIWYVITTYFLKNRLNLD